jgi:hypothetical protein
MVRKRMNAAMNCAVSLRRVPRPKFLERMGQVVDESGGPLPHARLELTSPVGPEVAYADLEGRFVVRLSPTETWPMTAQDSGFGAVTQDVSGIPGPVVFRLPITDTGTLPDVEQFPSECQCLDLFTPVGR